MNDAVLCGSGKDVDLQAVAELGWSWELAGAIVPGISSILGSRFATG
jgi:hypothetical protein